MCGSDSSMQLVNESASEVGWKNESLILELESKDELIILLYNSLFTQSINWELN